MYDIAVDLAKQHLAEICLSAAELIHAAKVEQYSQLAGRLEGSLQMQLAYLASGDLTEWQAYVAQVVKERVAQGLDYTNVIKAGQLLVEALSKFYEVRLLQECEGAINLKVGMSGKVYLQNVQRRLRGLNMTATSTATATGIKARQHPQNNNKPKP
jgi:hypothetical protein